MRRLVADIGGTNARLAVALDGVIDPATRQNFKVAENAGLEECLVSFTSEFDEAVIAVAGPPINNHIDFTNSPWVIDANAMTVDTGKTFTLINDFAAQALAASHLGKDDLIILGPEREQVIGSPLVVLGAGTGLGVAGGISTGSGFTPFPGEGGHIGFSPRTDYQRELARFILKDLKIDRVSGERILCGDGMVNLHRAVSALETGTAETLEAKDITNTGLQGSASVAAKTLAEFCDILGNVAGDLALAFGAKRGVFISGGIGLVLKDFLVTSTFREAFDAKGRLSHVNAALMTALITREDVGLVGAALYN